MYILHIKYLIFVIELLIYNQLPLNSPRDATSGLGVKMVEYVLNGSPTNKDSPLSGLEPRLRSLKFDEGDKVSVLMLIECKRLNASNKKMSFSVTIIE